MIGAMKKKKTIVNMIYFFTNQSIVVLVFSKSSDRTCVVMIPVTGSLVNAVDDSSNVATSALRSFRVARFFSSSVSTDSPVKIDSSLRVMNAKVDNPRTIPDLGGIAMLHRLMKCTA